MPPVGHLCIIALSPIGSTVGISIASSIDALSSASPCWGVWERFVYRGRIFCQADYCSCKNQTPSKPSLKSKKEVTAFKTKNRMKAVAPSLI